MSLLLRRRNSFTNLLLDNYPALSAWSLRKIKTSYSGNCIQVRRSSDSTTQNIGFSNGQIDTSALLSFVGSGDGFVSIWYDQEGAHNLTSSASNQPQIVSSGSVVTDPSNSLPSILFADGKYLTKSSISNQYLDADSLFCGVANSTNSNKVGVIFSENMEPFTSQDRITITHDTSTNKIAVTYRGDTTVINLLHGTRQSTGIQLRVYQRNGTTIEAYKSNTLIDSATATETYPTGTSQLNIGLQQLGPSYFNGHIQECILWNNDESANRTTISNNIINYYSI